MDIIAIFLLIPSIGILIFLTIYLMDDLRKSRALMKSMRESNGIDLSKEERYYYDLYKNKYSKKGVKLLVGKYDVDLRKFICKKKYFIDGIIRCGVVKIETLNKFIIFAGKDIEEVEIKQKNELEHKRVSCEFLRKAISDEGLLYKKKDFTERLQYLMK